MLHPVVSGRRGHAYGSVVAQHLYSGVLGGILLGDAHGVVGGVVIHYQKFPVMVFLMYDRLYCFAKKLRRVVHGHDDRNQFVGICASLFLHSIYLNDVNSEILHRGFNSF